MDHKYIDEFDIVERYLSRKLAEGETAEFEEHFVDCVECVGRLETTKAFADGLRRVASDRAAAAPDRPNEILENERSTTARKAFAVAAGVLSLIIIAAAVLAFAQVRRYGAEAVQARNAAIEWERRYEEERELSATNAKDRQASERELTEQVAQLKLDLENERKTGLHDDVQINLPIVGLTSTRGTGPEPAKVVTLSRSSSSFAVVLALEGESGYSDYIVTIFGSQKEPIWKRGGFRANDNAISMRFNSTLFRTGAYLLTLDGVARDGSISAVGKYPFRVVKPQ